MIRKSHHPTHDLTHDLVSVLKSNPKASRAIASLAHAADLIKAGQSGEPLAYAITKADVDVADLELTGRDSSVWSAWRDVYCDVLKAEDEPPQQQDRAEPSELITQMLDKIQSTMGGMDRRQPFVAGITNQGMKVVSILERYAKSDPNDWDFGELSWEIGELVDGLRGAGYARSADGLERLYTTLASNTGNSVNNEPPPSPRVGQYGTQPSQQPSQPTPPPSKPLPAPTPTTPVSTPASPPAKPHASRGGQAPGRTTPKPPQAPKPKETTPAPRSGWPRWRRNHS